MVSSFGYAGDKPFVPGIAIADVAGWKPRSFRDRASFEFKV